MHSPPSGRPATVSGLSKSSGMSGMSSGNGASTMDSSKPFSMSSSYVPTARHPSPKVAILLRVHHERWQKVVFERTKKQMYFNFKHFVPPWKQKWTERFACNLQLSSLKRDLQNVDLEPTSELPMSFKIDWLRRHEASLRSIRMGHVVASVILQNHLAVSYCIFILLRLFAVLFLEYHIAVPFYNAFCIAVLQLHFEGHSGVLFCRAFLEGLFAVILWGLLAEKSTMACQRCLCAITTCPPSITTMLSITGERKRKKTVNEDCDAMLCAYIVEIFTRVSANCKQISYSEKNSLIVISSDLISMFWSRVQISKEKNLTKNKALICIVHEVEQNEHWGSFTLGAGTFLTKKGPITTRANSHRLKVEG